MLPAVSKLSFIKDEVQAIPQAASRPPRMAALRAFGGRVTHAVRLTVAEPEILVFALLQWAAVAGGYYLWVAFLGWIPDEVWATAEQDGEVPVADIALLLWSVFVVVLVSLPVGLLSGCICAAHVLRRQGQESTVATCLAMVLPRAWSLWAFSAVDGWWTVKRIFERLPRKGRRERNRALKEAAYYAWKLGTVGMLPGLVTGRGLVEAGKQSVGLVKERPAETAVLRVGYSLACWVIAILGYVGAGLFFRLVTPTLPDGTDRSQTYLAIFLWLGVPIVLTAGLVLVLLRPIFLIGAADVYCDLVESRGEQLVVPGRPAAPVRILVAGTVLVLIAVAVLVLAEDFGLVDLMQPAISR